MGACASWASCWDAKRASRRVDATRLTAREQRLWHVRHLDTGDSRVQDSVSKQC